MKICLKNGFTLLELSIVLVIIGLIIGGITVGRDLIRAAEIHSSVSKLQQLELAAQAFRLKYDGIPGDIANAVEYQLHLNEAGVNTACSTLSSTNYQSDGDGVLEGYNISTSGTTRYNAEVANYFIHLSNIGMMDETIIGNKNPNSWCQNGGAADYGVEGVHYPSLPIGGGVIKIYDVLSNGYFYVIGGMGSSHHYSINHVSATARFSDTLTPQMAQSIDNKLDDGAALSGAVRVASSINGYRNHSTLTRGYITIDDADGATNCVYNADYNLQYEEEVCTLLMKASK